MVYIKFLDTMSNPQVPSGYTPGEHVLPRLVSAHLCAIVFFILALEVLPGSTLGNHTHRPGGH